VAGLHRCSLHHSQGQEEGEGEGEEGEGGGEDGSGEFGNLRASLEETVLSPPPPPASLGSAAEDLASASGSRS